MFADAEVTISKILGLVEMCPEKLQEKCFELLMEAYLASKQVPSPAHGIGAHPAGQAAPTPPTPAVQSNGSLPEALRPRFTATAGRLGLSVDRLATLFDFQLDPYNFHALAVPGVNKAERCRNVALLLCAKSYLTMSDWSADWKEFRAVCIDQGCWDQANVGSHLAKTGFFKTASAADNVALTSKGTAAAESMLSTLSSAEQT